MQGFPYCGAAVHVLGQGLPTYGHAGRGESPLHPPGMQPVSKHWMEVCLNWSVQRPAHLLESAKHEEEYFCSAQGMQGCFWSV